MAMVDFFREYLPWINFGSHVLSPNFIQKYWKLRKIKLPPATPLKINKVTLECIKCQRPSTKSTKPQTINLSWHVTYISFCKQLHNYFKVTSWHRGSISSANAKTGINRTFGVTGLTYQMTSFGSGHLFIYLDWLSLIGCYNEWRHNVTANQRQDYVTSPNTRKRWLEPKMTSSGRQSCWVARPASKKTAVESFQNQT